MRKLAVCLMFLGVLLAYSRVWAQSAPGSQPPTVGEERKEEQKKKELATRVSEVERGGALLPSGRLVMEPSFEYDHISGTSTSISGFTIFQAILIGKVQTETLKRDLFIPALTVRAGLKDAELYVRIPYFFRTDNLALSGVGRRHHHPGPKVLQRQSPGGHHQLSLLSRHPGGAVEVLGA